MKLKQIPSFPKSTLHNDSIGGKNSFKYFMLFMISVIAYTIFRMFYIWD